jgi:hypothetical protein
MTGYRPPAVRWLSDSPGSYSSRYSISPAFAT